MLVYEVVAIASWPHWCHPSQASQHVNQGTRPTLTVARHISRAPSSLVVICYHPLFLSSSGQLLLARAAFGFRVGESRVETDKGKPPRLGWLQGLLLTHDQGRCCNALQQHSAFLRGWPGLDTLEFAGLHGTVGFGGALFPQSLPCLPVSLITPALGASGVRALGA